MPERTLALELSTDEARWLRNVVGRLADRYDDPEAPALHRRLDELLNPRDYEVPA